MNSGWFNSSTCKRPLPLSARSEVALKSLAASHAELLAQGGLYARLWAHQSGGFLGEEADDAETAAA